jgi:hypothetical protein
VLVRKGLWRMRSDTGAGERIVFCARCLDLPEEPWGSKGFCVTTAKSVLQRLKPRAFLMLIVVAKAKPTATSNTPA